MALLTYADRVAETTITTGTSTISLLGASDAKFRTFVAGAGTGNTVPYVIVHRTANEYEVGFGVVTSGSPDTLTRGGVYASSTGSAINFSAGTKDVFLSLPASKTARFDDATDATTLTALTVTGASSIGTATSSEIVAFGQNNTTDKYIAVKNSGGDMYLGSGATSAYLWNEANTPLQFYTNNALRATLDASGNLGIGVAPSARNNTRLQIVDGIGFPATQVASSDVNTLDDYEEGTWTPIYEGTGGSIGATAYAVQQGSYTKIGNVVTVCAQVVLTNKGSWTGAVYIETLPFTPSASGGQNMGATWVENVTFADQINARIGPGEAYVTLRINTSAGVGSYLDAADVTNTSAFRFTVTYLV